MFLCFSFANAVSLSYTLTHSLTHSLTIYLSYTLTHSLSIALSLYLSLLHTYSHSTFFLALNPIAFKICKPGRQAGS